MPSYNQLIKVKRLRRLKKKICNVKALRHCPQKKGIVFKVRIVKPKKPNSAQRKIAKVRIFKRHVLTYIPGQGHMLKSFSEVLVTGGRANDLPGVRFSLIRGKFDFSYKENFDRVNKKSKYGYKSKAS